MQPNTSLFTKRSRPSLLEAFAELARNTLPGSKIKKEQECVKKFHWTHLRMKVEMNTKEMDFLLWCMETKNLQLICPKNKFLKAQRRRSQLDLEFVASNLIWIGLRNCNRLLFPEYRLVLSAFIWSRPQSPQHPRFSFRRQKDTQLSSKCPKRNLWDVWRRHCLLLLFWFSHMCRGWETYIHVRRFPQCEETLQCTNAQKLRFLIPWSHVSKRNKEPNIAVQNRLREFLVLHCCPKSGVFLWHNWTSWKTPAGNNQLEVCQEKELLFVLSSWPQTVNLHKGRVCALPK